MYVLKIFYVPRGQENLFEPDCYYYPVGKYGHFCVGLSNNAILGFYPDEEFQTGPEERLTHHVVVFFAIYHKT